MGISKSREASPGYRRNVGGNGDNWPPKYAKLELVFDDGVALAFLAHDDLGV